MITLLENVLERADGNYVSAQDLRLLDKTWSSWEARKEAYGNVQAFENQIIDYAAEAMKNSDRFTAKPMDSLGVARCRRDMILGLRCCALAMLLEDGEMLKDRVLYWQQNIFLSMQLNYQGYRFIMEGIQAFLPNQQAELFSPYLKMAHEFMNGK
ncbi:MAG: phycobilisome protein [Pseudanabaenaceae cyanobacterium bins.68]|nr:phycobilisome protein [Pseudanabaenaceae cyanobacterium bins.68]